MGKKTNAELRDRIAQLERENTSLKKKKFGSTVAAVAAEAIRWTGVCVLGYFGWRSVESLAGRTTVADFGVILDFKVREFVLIIVAFSGLIYGRVQKRLRRNTVERLQNRIREYEKRSDPGRTSSGLTPRGDTHPRDMP